MFNLEMDFFLSLKLEERKLSVIKCHLRGPPLGKKAQNIGDAKLRVRPVCFPISKSVVCYSYFRNVKRG